MANRFLNLRNVFKWKKYLRRHSSSTASVSQVVKGDKLHGYTVQEVAPVPELYLTAVKLSHDQTGAQHLHVAREDSNNAFSVGFRTTPLDDTGVSHILEHTVLCGSHKYPCRDPFFKMLNRSLSTFMNAMTGSDFTVYPFSTQNRKDYENLLSVYLDAVFFPNLNEMDFMQEGWRLEHEDNSDPSSPIIFKGVVFNEMKGAMSSPDQLYATRLQNRLHPTHTYSYNSGGEPLAIPQLTYQQLKDFHSTHYHPSNARFYTYGDLPLERHLELINNLALSKFNRINPGTEIPDEVRWNEGRTAKVTCPPDPMSPDPEKQTTVSMNYLLGSITDPQEHFNCSVLGSLLMSGPTSPFYKALIEANIGSDYSPSSGYNCSTRDASFSVGLQGISPKDEERVKEIIQQTFQKVVKEGFEEERIEALLHSIELSQKHEKTMFGLGLIFTLMSSWNQDGDPINHLKLNQLVSNFKDNMTKNPQFLQEKVEEYFVKNKHTLWMRMDADDEYKDDEEKKEADLLRSRVSGLSEEDRKDVMEKGLKLAEIQNTEEDISCLPTLKVTDIDPKVKTTEVNILNPGGIHLQCSEQPTNGVAYFRAISLLKDLPSDMLPYLSLFCNVITQMGAGNMSVHELAQKEELKTGGLGVSLHIEQSPHNIDQFEQGVYISSYCLEKNFEDMLNLWVDIFNRPRLSDLDRLTTLVRMEASELANSVAFMGHAYIMKTAGSTLSHVGHMKEVTGGLSQVAFMKSIAEMEDLSPVLEKLQQIASLVLSKYNMRCSLNATPEFMSSAVSQLESFLGNLRGDVANDYSPYSLKEAHYTPSSQKTHFQLPFPVNFVSHGIAAVPYTHQDFARLRILAKLMSAKFLHREIREKGGAYGSGATMGTEGAFKFFSYRDPHSTQTLDAFSRSVQWALDASYTQQDIDEAKLSVFSSVDSPVAPGNKGMTLFSCQITDVIRQTHRDQLFAVQRSDLIDVAQRYLIPNAQVSSYALLGPENEMTIKEGWTIQSE